MVLRLWPMNLQVHLRQRFLHVLNVLGGDLHHVGAVTQQGSNCADIAVWSEGSAQ